MLELRIIFFLKVHNNGLSWCHKIFWQSPWPGKNTCPFKYFQYNIDKFETYILLFYFLSKAALYRVFIMFIIFIFKDEVKKVYIIYIHVEDENPTKNNQNEQPLPYLPQPYPRTILCTYNYWKTHPTKNFAIKFAFFVSNKNIWGFSRFFAVAISIFQSSCHILNGNFVPHFKWK